MRNTLLCLTAALALAGCGGGDSDEDSLEDAVEGFPECSEVWEVGATLDLSTYGGCQDGDTVVAAVTRGCYDADSNYVGQVATFEDRLWVVQTGTDPKTGEGGTAGEVTDVDPKC